MSARTWDLVHRTTYTYPQDVTDSYGRAVLTPRDLPDQRRLTHTVDVDPAPADLAEEVDYFGNVTTYFAVPVPHRRLVVTARSQVEVTRTAPALADLPGTGWEQVAQAVAAGDVAAGDIAAGDAAAGDVGTVASGLVALREMRLPSAQVVLDDAVRAFAAPVFTPDRPLRDVVTDLSRRIATGLTYRTGSTTVHTTQAELLAQGAGVCQDFAHLAIAALRAHGLPARYVSGYLETRPGPDRPRLRGADASHAWFSVWLPGHGWWDVDPTNDKSVDDGYVVLGWGRDYHDVPPLRGVVFTEGNGSTLEVAVDLVPAGTDPYL
ncbi:MAG: transglutaminase family protein [Cellulomonas sp.]|nr:transglutaminase family protein [Cellulomonas sp.]